VVSPGGSGAATLTLPRLGETMESGRVVGWLKRPGEAFRRGETIVEIETDKTVVELPALADGRLLEILAAEGENVTVGMPLCRYEGGGGGTPAVVEAEKAEAAVAEVPSPAELGTSAIRADRPAAAEQRLRATPRARRLARARGIDLARIAGTGRRARVQGVDVLAAAPGAAGAGGPELDARGLLFADLPEGRLAYRAWAAEGAAARGTVLLLHGLGGDAETWAGFAPVLARQGWDVIAPDMPGHGATGIEAASVGEIAAPLAGLAASLGLGDVELVGHSLGAAAAVRAARDGSLRVRRLTLLAPVGLGAEIDGRSLPAWRCRTRRAGWRTCCAGPRCGRRSCPRRGWR
jgi:pyruvate dehydrogenase E2 component (dihydrolipoamide acetyltransferase)